MDKAKVEASKKNDTAQQVSVKAGETVTKKNHIVCGVVCIYTIQVYHHTEAGNGNLPRSACLAF